jgi:hypothetical protein
MDMSDEQTQKIAVNEKVAVTEDTEGHGTQTGSGDKYATEKYATEKYATEKYATEKLAQEKVAVTDDDTEGHSVLPPKGDTVAFAEEKFATEKYAQEKFAEEKFAEEK